MNDVIVMGYSPRKHIHVICNDVGLTQLPTGVHEYHDGGGNLHNGVMLAFTLANFVALRLIGALSERDVSAMMKHLKEDTPCP